MLCSCKGILDIAPPAKGLTVETRAHAIRQCSKSYWPRPTVKKEAQAWSSAGKVLGQSILRKRTEASKSYGQFLEGMSLNGLIIAIMLRQEDTSKDSRAAAGFQTNPFLSQGKESTKELKSHRLGKGRRFGTVHFLINVRPTEKVSQSSPLTQRFLFSINNGRFEQ